MKANYSKAPDQVLQFREREICIFNIDGKNIDHQVVNEFGEEWLKFNTFIDEAILAGANEYFDMVLAIFLYMPLVLWVRFLRAIGLKSCLKKCL